MGLTSLVRQEETRDESAGNRLQEQRGIYADVSCSSNRSQDQQRQTPCSPLLLYLQTTPSATFSSPNPRTQPYNFSTLTLFLLLTSLCGTLTAERKRHSVFTPANKIIHTGLSLASSGPSYPFWHARAWEIKRLPVGRLKSRVASPRVCLGGQVDTLSKKTGVCRRIEI
ncbi:hypothetical protein RRG08_037202 [Elysia crispata]|uniref:Uncharacterized protein n=1 Tax=Elysia crispata TaxID=231223 RepID=A0AAE1D9W5_9GAST|nr:hypothetical protein RRG08_037202 [Elysia crispata]